MKVGNKRPFLRKDCTESSEQREQSKRQKICKLIESENVSSISRSDATIDGHNDDACIIHQNTGLTSKRDESGTKILTPQALFFHQFGNIPTYLKNVSQTVSSMLWA